MSMISDVSDAVRRFWYTVTSPAAAELSMLYTECFYSAAASRALGNGEELIIFTVIKRVPPTS